MLKNNKYNAKILRQTPVEIPEQPKCGQLKYSSSCRNQRDNPKANKICTECDYFVIKINQ
ncbi:MAG: hypothetical protein CO139_02715 [Candidatus Moranbacteria bacterium CG_4_9_14_3_um_filter_36_9]|nr:MAG: hypothetical protein CO139_02715 [Candidatus Moranbacteria bacterium CG_4_9_14_3_um_filter_36_9]